MDESYQKYYNELNGKDFTKLASKNNDEVSSAKNNLSNIKSLISSNNWVEKGINSLDSSIIPSITSDIEKLQSNMSIIKAAVAKIPSLLSLMSQLEDARRAYNSCDKEQKSYYGEKVSILQTKVDNLINEINGVQVDTSISCYSASGSISDGSNGQVYSSNNKKYSIPSDPEIAAKKVAFIGDYDDPNNYTHFAGSREQLTSRINHLQLFDNTTGEILSDNNEINMKVGETRVITVKLPSDTGKINRIVRTTADNNGSSVISCKSDIDPDPNNVEYVRIAEPAAGGPHYPSDMSLLQNNCYDWIIEAKAPGCATPSTTTLWESEDLGSYGLKSTAGLVVNVSE